MNKYPFIRKIYLYLFTMVGLSLVVIGGVQLVNLGLKAYVFTKADVYYDYPRVMATKAPIEPGGEPVEIGQPSQEEIDEYQTKQKTSQRHRDAANALAYIIVGLPLYLYHWSVIKKDKGEELTNAK